jgi:hypothetical protein
MMLCTSSTWDVITCTDPRSGHGYKEKLYGKPPKQRKSTVLTSMVPDVELGTFSDSMHNLRIASLQRVLMHKVGSQWVDVKTQVPSPGYFGALLPEMNALKAILSPAGEKPMSRMEYASQYPGSKRLLYERAALRMDHEPLVRNDSDIEGFLKFEKDIRSDKPGRVPRVISPPKVKYRLETGRFVRPAEHVIYKAIDELFGMPVVVKGKNYDGVAAMVDAAWADFSNPMGLDADVSKMDKFTGPENIDFTNELVAQCFDGADRLEIAKILKWQLNYRTTLSCSEGRISYFHDWGLTSGQTNTSLVGVVQVTTIVKGFSRFFRVKLRMIDAGDDFSIFFEACDEKLVTRELVPWFKRFGFILEAGSSYSEKHKMEFCQTRPLNIGGRTRMVRNPRTVMAKDTVSLTELRNSKEEFSHYRSVGIGGLSCFGGVPILQDYYAALIRGCDNLLDKSCLTSRQKKRWHSSALKQELDGSMRWYGEAMKYGYKPVAPEDRLSMYLAFGYTPQEQESIEEQLRSWTLVPSKQLDISELGHVLLV